MKICFLLPAFLILPLTPLPAAVTCEFTSAPSKPETDETELQRITIPRIAVPPKIDGILDDSAWRTCSAIGDFVWVRDEGQKRRQAFADKDIKEDVRMKVSEQTKVMYCYDANSLYIAFNCMDSQAEKIVAKEKNGSGCIWLDDCIELMFNTDPAGNIFHFLVNAEGAFSAERGSVQSMKMFLPRIETAAKRNSGGWTLELKIPFEELGLSTPKESSSWRINFFREQQSKKEFSSWSETKQRFMEPEAFGMVLFNTVPEWQIAGLDWGEGIPGGNIVKLKIKNTSNAVLPVRITLSANGRIAEEKTYSLPDNNGITVFDLPYYIEFETPEMQLVLTIQKNNNPPAEIRKQSIAVPGKFMKCHIRQSNYVNNPETPVEIDFKINATCSLLKNYSLKIFLNNAVKPEGNIETLVSGIGTLRVTSSTFLEGENRIRLELSDRYSHIVASDNIVFNIVSNPFQ